MKNKAHATHSSLCKADDTQQVERRGGGSLCSFGGYGDLKLLTPLHKWKGRSGKGEGE